MMASVTLVDVLRSLQFYMLSVPLYFITAFLIIIVTLLLLPLLIFEKKLFYNVTNRLLYLNFYISSLVLNYAWRCVILGQLPKDIKKKARIIMFNHLSAADAFLVSSLGISVPIIFTYKDSLNKLPTAVPIFPLTGHLAIKFTYDKANDKKIPVRESVKALMKNCKWSIENGLSVGVYPEGKRSRDGRLGEFKDGFFRFAIENDVEILPCAIGNSNALWPLKNKFIIGEGVGYINIGEPITSQGKTLDELKHETRKAIYELLKQCPSFNPETETVPELS